MRSPGASSAWGRTTSSSGPQDGRFLPGEIIADRYRIIALLGRGGMGEVYRADDLKLGQPVALKFLSEAFLSDEDRLDRFLDEVRIARQVSHANVCRTYDIGEVDGQHFISMEFIDGEDLASLLRRIGRLPPDKALQIARQICAGLAAAHAQGILHRDLKPANIMIDGRGLTRITDFGLAGLAEGFEGAEVGAGTPAYMAPEQLSGTEVSARSDVYALGLTLYELFTGRPAFRAQSAAEYSRLQQTAVPESPSRVVEGLDPIVERVILRCLEKDPGLRPTSPLAVAASLPGGNPIAEALAAGETPSPEMVADAGEVGGLRPWVGLALLASVVVGFVLSVLLINGLTVWTLVPLPKTPEALASKAQEVLEGAGYSEPPNDQAFGWIHTGEYARYQIKNAPAATRWSAIASVRPAPIQFWYLQSPRILAPERPGWQVGINDPPPVNSGLSRVVVDPSGRLLEMYVVPPERDAAEGPFPYPDWSPLLARAGLDAAKLTPARPIWNPPLATDQRAAWEGTYEGQPGVPIRAEAGSYHGKPVYFQIVPPWKNPTRMEPFQEPATQRIVGLVALFFFAAVLVFGCWLGIRNLRLGRGDRKGAFKLAAYWFVAIFLGAALGGHHVPAMSELGKVLETAAFTLLGAATVWALYIALEPYVRRYWPNALISWSRLMAGRFRDPLVGRDLLIGAVLAIGVQLIALVGHRISDMAGADPTVPTIGTLSTLLGLRGTLSYFFQMLASSLLSPIILLFVLLVLRVLLRRDWAALLTLLAILGAVAFSSREGASIATIPFTILALGIVLWVMMRYGLLASAMGSLIGQMIGSTPITFHLASWWAGWNFVPVVLVFALLCYATYISFAGRPIIGKNTFGYSR